MKNRSISTTFTWLFTFSVAMAMLEAAVVIYLRIIFFPKTFNFPMVDIPDLLKGAELSRELATLIMLAAIGCFAGHNKPTRFAWFLVAFAVWDIFYYVFLYVFLQWPESILGWDILFLIPVPWYGPVLSPVLVSLTLICFAAVILYAQAKPFPLRTNSRERWLIWLGCVVILCTYVYDFILYTYRLEVTLRFAFTTYIPKYYNWPLFSFGIGLVMTGIGMFLYRVKQGERGIMKAMF